MPRTAIAVNQSNPPLEIERKFLLHDLPKDLDRATGQPIRQGYLCNAGNRSVRIRQKGDQYFLTCKAGIGIARQEAETTITAKQFEILWSMTAGHQLNKTRYTHHLGTRSQPGYTLEIDVFDDELSALSLVEVEFENLQQADAFVPPKWFGAEVTQDKRFLNASLAQHGLPENWQESTGNQN